MKKIEGVMTAIVTPFKENMEVDFNSLETLIKDQLKKGVRGFVVNGTTGESPTLEDSEIKEIWQAVKAWAGPESIMILGTGSNSTKKTILNTQIAKEWNADAALVVVPYYNKPPQRGLFQHFKKVAEESHAPIILYNVPGRSACSLSAETTAELSHVKGIIGIKDATGDMEIAEAISRQAKPEFIKLSGDDGSYVKYLSHKGQGIISVASHIIPEAFVKMTELAKLENFVEAQKIQDEYRELIESLYVEANPIPVKKALELIKIIKLSNLRLPMLEAGQSTVEKLKRTLQQKGFNL
jgi:4-hydroxy-tetrahydrodipicolinate synthase